MSRRVLQVGIGILIGIVPLLWHYGASLLYELPKYSIFVGGIQLLWLSFFLLFLKDRKKISHNFLTKLTLLILLYAICVFLSDIFGLDIKVSLLGSTYRYQGFLTLISCIQLYFMLSFFALSTKNSKQTFTYFITILFFSSIVVAGYGLYQAVAFFFLKDCFVPTYMGRIVGTFGYPNFLSGFLVAILPIVLLRFQKYELFKISFIPNPFFKTLYSILITSVILFTQSRAAILALIFVFLYYLFYLAKTSPHRIKAILLVIGIGLAEFILLSYIGNWSQQATTRCSIAMPTYTLVTPAQTPPTASNPTSSTHSPEIATQPSLPFYSFAPEDIKIPLDYIFMTRASNWDSRSTFWLQALAAVPQRPILGFGQENFELILPPQYMVKVDNAHNIFLETLIASGFVGLILFFGILFLAAKQASLPIRLGLIAFIIAAQFNPLSVAQVMLLWTLIGLSTYAEL